MKTKQEIKQEIEKIDSFSNEFEDELLKCYLAGRKLSLEWVLKESEKMSDKGFEEFVEEIKKRTV